MPTSPAADRLRRRAAALDVLARLLQHCSALDLHLAAGADTWVGPSPQACLDDVRARRRQLLDHADSLLREGRRFRRIADEIDAHTAALPGAQ